MATKHKVLKDFQLLTEDKKILILKAKTIIEDFKFKTKTEVVNVPSDIIRNNPEYFSYIDWKEELQSYLKTNKIPQPAVITKKLVPFIEDLMEENSTKEVIKEKEVIREIMVEKPTIVEKEVVIEKLVNDQALVLDLENKIKKLDLKENQLNKEIEVNNLRELDLSNKEKLLNTKENELFELERQTQEKKQKYEIKEEELSIKEEKISFKENNLSGFISRSDLLEKLSNYESKGFDMRFFRSILDEI